MYIVQKGEQQLSEPILTQIAYANLILVKEQVYIRSEVIIAGEALSWLLLSWVHNPSS